MMAPAKMIPTTVKPLGSYVRDWDGETVEFFARKSWRRSHDRRVDGIAVWRAVAAVNKVIVWNGPTVDDEATAQQQALDKLAELSGA